jgi:ERCC4-type nuclease
MDSPEFHGCRVVLDYRESALAELLPGAECQPLPVGDVLISLGGRPRLLLERKTAADLAASISDGRWKEQTSRLEGAEREAGAERETGRLVVGVVVEGLVRDDSAAGFAGSGSISGPTISNVLLSASVRKGIVVLFSRSPADTASILLRACRALSRPSKTAAQKSIETLAPSRRFPGKPRTDGACDPKAAGAAMLTVVPGVSPVLAEEIMRGHKSFSALLVSLTSVSPEERLAALADVRHGASKRRTGESVARRILQHLDVA